MLIPNDDLFVFIGRVGEGQRIRVSDDPGRIFLRPWPTGDAAAGSRRLGAGVFLTDMIFDFGIEGGQAAAGGGGSLANSVARMRSIEGRRSRHASG